MIAASASASLRPCRAGTRPCRPGRLGVGCALKASGEFRRLVTHRAVHGEQLRTIQRGRRDIRLRAGGSGRVRTVAGRWISRLCCVDGHKDLRSRSEWASAAFAIGIRSFERWSGRDRTRGVRIAPGELQSSSSSSVSSVLPVLASRESSTVRPSRFFALTSYLPCSRSISYTSP